MKLVMTLLVRDEEDILKDNIEYHLSQGVDFIIATDNRSVDDTADILKYYEKKDLLHYIYEAEDNYSQHQWVTKMARMAYVEYGADWIINNDADEFWWPRAGSLKETFRKIPAQYNIVIANRYNFVAIENNASSFYENMIYREKVSFNPLGKPLPPKVAHRGSDMVSVAQGNHSVDGLEDSNIIDELIDIFHFPIRSYAQLENKIIKGGAAYERNTELPAAMGGTWRELYKEYQQNNNLQSYYQKNFYDEKRLKKELDAGLIEIDERLAMYFTKNNICFKKLAT